MTIGEIDERAKSEFLGEARALLFPIDWPEPFLSMIEAMACGTPLLAFCCGSVPEIVDPGVTGLIVDTMEEAVKTLPQVLEPIAMRGSALEERFSATRMAKNYLQVYHSLLSRESIADRDTPVPPLQPVWKRDELTGDPWRSGRRTPEMVVDTAFRDTVLHSGDRPSNAAAPHAQA